MHGKAKPLLDRKVVEVSFSASLSLFSLYTFPYLSPSPEISALTSRHVWCACLFYCTCLADPLQTFPDYHVFSKLPQNLHALRPFCNFPFARRRIHFSCVRFLNNLTSKSAPKPKCFSHFVFESCFSLQLCANFALFSQRMAPRTLLWQTYFSTLLL